MYTAQVCAVVPIASNHPNLSPLVNWLSDRVDQVIVSSDGTPIELSQNDKVEVLVSPRSRGGQIRTALQHTNAQLVWVVHVDSQALDAAWTYLETLARTHFGKEDLKDGSPDTQLWGRFDVHLESLPLIAWFMNHRSRLTSICTGDQAMFFSQSLLNAIGGYPGQSLMEDIECSKLAKRIPGAQFLAPPIAIETSAQRWLAHGVTKTILSMWWFRLRYFFGASPDYLYKRYYS